MGQTVSTFAHPTTPLHLHCKRTALSLLPLQAAQHALPFPSARTHTRCPHALPLAPLPHYTPCPHQRTPRLAPPACLPHALRPTRYTAHTWLASYARCPAFTASFLCLCPAMPPWHRDRIADAFAGCIMQNHAPHYGDSSPTCLTPLRMGAGGRLDGTGLTYHERTLPPILPWMRCRLNTGLLVDSASSKAIMRLASATYLFAAAIPLLFRTTFWFRRRSPVAALALWIIHYHYDASPSLPHSASHHSSPFQPFSLF